MYCQKFRTVTIVIAFQNFRLNPLKLLVLQPCWSTRSLCYLMLLMLQIATCSAALRAIHVAETDHEELVSSEESYDLNSFELHPRSKWFTAAQIACLKVHHSNGMTRTSKKLIHMIEKSAAVLVLV